MNSNPTSSEGIFKKPRYRIAGDRGLLVEFGDRIEPAVNTKVRAMGMALDSRLPEGVIEVIPTYRSLLIIYDPAVTRPEGLQSHLSSLENRLDAIQIPDPVVVTIPVAYGGEFGPDIGHVAECHQLGVAEVIRLHSQPEYPIYMIGFTPGFPFLGGLHSDLHTPRLETPRTLVPEGSVGIANNQTGIYPVASPGGWRIIGRTPLKLFDPARNRPFLYKAGDRLRFEPIDAETYHRLKEGETT